MRLSKDLETELARRLEILAHAQAEDPAFVDLPIPDRLALAVILVGSLAAVALMIINRFS